MTDHELAQVIWDYMCYEQPIQEADMIIGLGCRDMGVARHVADLYFIGTAPKVMFCGGAGRLSAGLINNEADRFAEEAIRMGVPDSVTIRERTSTNTGESIQNAAELLIESKLEHNRTIIVHKPYMLRRDYATEAMTFC